MLSYCKHPNWAQCALRYSKYTLHRQVAATGKGVVEERDIERAFVSYPAPFKHLAFDGRFLHGVPEQLMRDKAHCSIQGEQHIIKEFEGASAKGDNNNERANDPSAFSPSSRLRVSAPRYTQIFVDLPIMYHADHLLSTCHWSQRSD